MLTKIEKLKLHKETVRQLDGAASELRYGSLTYTRASYCAACPPSGSMCICR